MSFTLYNKRRWSFAGATLWGHGKLGGQAFCFFNDVGQLNVSALDRCMNFLSCQSMIACNGHSTNSSKMLLYPYAPHNATTSRRYTQATSAMFPIPHKKAGHKYDSHLQHCPTSSCPSSPPSPSPSPSQSWPGSYVPCLNTPNQNQHKSISTPTNIQRHKCEGNAIRTLLSARLLNLRSSPIPHQPIMRLKLLHNLMAIIDERETSALAASVLCSEAKAGHLVFVGFVELGEF